jgi:hypothetical protein
VSFVAFHERGFSIPAGRFIRRVLFAYGLQLQHLNPNSIQQVAAFETMCEGFLGIGAHWDLFRYFFRFACLTEGSCAATIGYANLRTKQGCGDDYIPVSLTSSNIGWHKGWSYLRNDPEHVLSAYIGCSIAKSQRNWSDGPVKEQEKMLKSHWAVLECLRHAGITLVEVVGQYHARGVVSLRRRSLLLCDMTADRAPLGGDCDRTGAPVATRSSAPRGASDREVDLFVAAVADASNAPQRGDRENCELFIFSASFVCPFVVEWSSRG